MTKTERQIKWTTATRPKLHGSLRPHPQDPPNALPTLKQAWKHLSTLPIPHVPDPPPSVASMLASASAQEPPEKLTSDGEIARTMLLFSPPDPLQWDDWSTARALVALWHDVAGVRFIADTLLRPPPFTPLKRQDSDGVTVTFGAPPSTTDDAHAGPIVSNGGCKPLWWALRGRLGALSDEAFADAVASCAALFETPPTGAWDKGSWWRRAALVFAFARDEKRAAAEIDWFVSRLREEKAAHPERKYWWWSGAELLMAAAPDLERAAALTDYAMLGVYALDLVDRFGVDAKPVIEAVFNCRKGYSSTRLLKPELDALKMIDKALA